MNLLLWEISKNIIAWPHGVMFGIKSAKRTKKIPSSNILFSRAPSLTATRNRNISSLEINIMEGSQQGTAQGHESGIALVKLTKESNTDDENMETGAGTTDQTLSHKLSMQDIRPQNGSNDVLGIWTISIIPMVP